MIYTLRTKGFFGVIESVLVSSSVDRILSFAHVFAARHNSAVHGSIPNLLRRPALTCISICKLSFRPSIHDAALNISRLLLTQFNTKFPLHQLAQRTPIPHVHPLAAGALVVCLGALLLMHRIAGDDPVVTEGSRDWRRQPDLLVGRLLVDYVGTNRCVDGEDAGLGLGY